MPDMTIADCSTGRVVSRPMTAAETTALQQAQADAQGVATANTQRQQAALTTRRNAAATALNNSTAFLDPAVVPTPTARQLADAKAQRDAWAQMLGAQPLTIPVTEQATGNDVVLL